MSTPPLPLHKLEALRAAIAGQMLTSDQIEVLKACEADYRFTFRLGNGFKLTRELITELLELVYDDVPYMVGERRKRAIRILNASGAKGFQAESFWKPSRSDDKLCTRIDEDDIVEAVYE